MMKCKKKVIDKRFVVALTVAMAFAVGAGVADAATKDITLVKDWNLVNTPLEPTAPAIDTVLAGKGYITAWAWDATAKNWKVRVASESGAAIGTYATSKGFANLTEVHAGQGFWLNMSAAGTLTVDGTAPANTTSTLVAGWNLVGSKYDQVKSTADIVAALGAAQVKPLSLWKWQGANWAVALPYKTDGTAMADGGAAYAATKGFATLSAVASTDGYWVNGNTSGNPTDTPPEVGKVYKTTDANTYVPLANAPVFLNGVQIGTTDANGNFALPANIAPTDVITVGSGNEYTVSASTLTGGQLYMFAQDQDANKVTLTQADTSTNKPTAKKICSSNGEACITVSNMQLTKDITVAVTPYQSPLSIPTLAQITGMTCLDQDSNSIPCNYQAVAGADVIFTDSMGETISQTEAGFQGKVVPQAGNFLTELTGADLEDYLTNGIGSVDLLEYVNGVWTKVGASQITGVASKVKNDNGTPDNPNDDTLDDGPKTYTLKGVEGSTLSGLNPFAFGFKSDFIKGSIQVTVTNKGLLYKSVSGDNIVITNTEGQGAVLDESFDGPVAGALVTTDNSSAFVTTAADGKATIEYLLPPDNPNLSLLIKKDGYFDGTATFNVIDDTAKTVDLLEVPSSAAVGGVIKNAETKVGIAGAQVTLKNPIVLDKIGEEDGTIMVGLDSEATYLWEISKQGTDVWVTIAEGLAKNSITQQEIKTTLVTNFTTFIAGLTQEEKDALGQNPAGTYDVRITVTHPFSNLNYVESATGYLDVTFDLTKFNETASLSGALLGQISVFGGKDLGFYYSTVPNLPKDYLQSYTWQTSLKSEDSAGVIEIAQGPVTDVAFYMFTDAINLLQKNYIKLISDCGFQGDEQGKTCLQSGISIWVQLTGNYEFGPSKTPVTKQVEAQFDVPAMVDPLAPLVVGKFVVLPNTTMAFEEKQETDLNGSYLFPFVDPQLNGMLGLYAAADAYYPNNLFLDATGYELLIGWITPADLELTPVATVDMPPAIGSTEVEPEPDKTNVDITGFPDPTGYLETFELAVVDGSDPSLFTTAANNGPWKVEGVADEGENTVRWWSLATPEAVGPAQGQIQYPLIDANADGTADGSATGAYLLPAYDGTGVAWFGNKTTATISNMVGNYSSGAKSGTLTSSAIDLANYSFATLDFAAWFEVESVDVAKWQYDQMKVEVAVVAAAYPVTIGDYTFNSADDWKIVTFMNPDFEAAVQQADINFSSGGNDAVPVWVKKQANLSPFAGQKIKLRFNFQSQDSLYNGGRGWAVDNVAIINGDSGLPFTLEQSNYWWKAPTRKP